MSGTDIVLLAFILFGAFRGYREGFLMELFALVGIILGILGGFKLMGLSLVLLSERFDIDEKILPYVAFGLVFIIIVVAVSLIGRMLRASIDKSFLGRVDQAAGAVLGLIKTVFIISVALWIFTSTKWNIPGEWTEDSKLLPYISSFAPLVTGWISDWIPAFRDIF